MFKSARLKLTAWYLIMIMTVALLFSSAMYVGVYNNTYHVLEMQRRELERQYNRFNRQSGYPKLTLLIDPLALEEIRKQTLLNLLGINLMILFAAGSIGYFLAGKTLEPIEIMVKKQKRFISDAAHELKTPLTAMKTELEVNLRDKSLTLESSKKVLRSTIDEVDKLHGFMLKLLNQSKYQNIVSSKYTAVELNKVLDSILSKLAPMIKEKKIDVSTDLKTLQVLGQPEELEDLFTNLVENAIKYSKPGGTINITLTKEHNFALIQVQDSGIGIAKEDLPNIFEPFYRADKARSASGSEGFGLGLTIAKEIVVNHSGTITAQSELGKGTVFNVKLPINKESN